MKKNTHPFWFDDKTYQDMCRDFVSNHSQPRAVKTLNEYQIVLRAFRRWLIENGHTDLDEEIIKMWTLDNVQKACVTTVSGKSIILSQFLDYLISHGMWTGNPFAALRKQHRRGYREIARVLKETGSISELDALADTPFSGKLAHHFLDFIEYEKALGKTFQTQRRYLASFERYLRHEKITDLDRIDSRLVDEWNESFGPSTAYQKRVRLMRVNQFLDFLHGQERIRTAPIQQLPPLRRRLRRPYIFSREEVKSILAAAERLPDYRLKQRRGPTYRMLFLMLYTLGLRTSEAIKLRLEDVDFMQDTLTIHHAKFHKGRVLPFGPRFKAALQRHINEHPLLRKAPAESFLFPSESHRTPHLMPENCYRTLRRIIEGLHIKAPAETLAPNPHSLRHSFAVHRFEKWMRDGDDVGVKLPLLSAFLGHIDIAGTQVYLTMTPERLTLLGDRFEKAFGKPRHNDEEED
jgi:site-specific recombinase XerD